MLAKQKTNHVVVNSIAIVGVGLIGGSLALAIIENNVCAHLHLYDKSSAARSNLKKIFINNNSKNINTHIHNSLAIAVKNADLVIIAAPLSSYQDILITIAKKLKPSAIVSDVGSVKKSVLIQFQQLLPTYINAIPAHPVAGTEHSSAKNAYHNLFKNRYTIITPYLNENKNISKNNIEKNNAIKIITKIWRAVGAFVIEITSEKHDEILALSSHLPHAVAYALVLAAMDSKHSRDLAKLSAGGFRDFSRIAASSPHMWRDIFLENPKYLLESINKFKAKLNLIENAIKNNNASKLADNFKLAKKSRQKILDQGQAGVFLYSENYNNLKNKK